jgi:hypothetical protein
VKPLLQTSSHGFFTGERRCHGEQNREHLRLTPPGQRQPGECVNTDDRKLSHVSGSEPLSLHDREAHQNCPSKFENQA